MTNNVASNTRENGGRVIILFLLFLLALYELSTSGFSTFAIICILPIAIPVVYAIFRWRMAAFWALIFINYFVMFFGKNRILPNGIPTSMYNELLEILLIGVAIIDARVTPHFDRAMNLMTWCVIIWCSFCTLEVLNDTCGLGINVGNWYSGARLMAFQILYAVLVFTLYMSTADQVKKYIKVWAGFCLFTVFWTWKQQHIGFTQYEDAWLQTTGRHTHIVNGITRYFSTFNDAASYGCNAAASAVLFYVVAITSKLKRDRYFFLFAALATTWGMFASGTRTAIVCLFLGFMVFIVLSKSTKIAIGSSVLIGIVAFLLIFTTIGQGNAQIRRMRSAFNKEDASSNVRKINQAAIAKYIKDAPWGIGIGTGYENIPANNKYRKLSTIPPDSEYVFIWMHTGPIGITVFLITTAIMWLGACYIVFTKLKNRSMMGVGAGLCSAFAAIQLGGYGNAILMQFPNCLTFYGGLAIVYILPYIESEWIELEEKLFAEQEERKRLKLEKKRASRV